MIKKLAQMNILTCPNCKDGNNEPDLILRKKNNSRFFVCKSCNYWYPIKEGIPILLPQELQNPKADGGGFLGQLYMHDIKFKYTNDNVPNYHNKRLERCPLKLKMCDGYQKTIYLSSIFSKTGVKDEPPLSKSFHRTRKILLDSLIQREYNREKLFADFGCADGLYLLRHRKGFREAIGLDICFPIKVKKNAELNGIDILIIQGDLERLPFKSDSIDIGLSTETLEHCPKLEDALKELKRVLRQKLICSVPYNKAVPRPFVYLEEGTIVHHDEEEERAYRLKKINDTRPTHEWDFNPVLFPEYINKNHFKVHKILYSVNIPFPHDIFAPLQLLFAKHLKQKPFSSTGSLIFVGEPIKA